MSAPSTPRQTRAEGSKWGGGRVLFHLRGSSTGPFFVRSPLSLSLTYLSDSVKTGLNDIKIKITASLESNSFSKRSLKI